MTSLTPPPPPSVIAKRWRDEWQPIETAPKDGTAFQAKIPGHGSDNVIGWTDGLTDSDDHPAGGWTLMADQEPPDSWTDGICWEVNEDGVASVQPTHWKPLGLGPTDPTRQPNLHA